MLATLTALSPQKRKPIGEILNDVYAGFSTLSKAVFIVMSILQTIHVRLYVELKTMPRFCPVSFNLFECFTRVGSSLIRIH